MFRGSKNTIVNLASFGEKGIQRAFSTTLPAFDLPQADADEESIKASIFADGWQPTRPLEWLKLPSLTPAGACACDTLSRLEPPSFVV